MIERIIINWIFINNRRIKSQKKSERKWQKNFKKSKSVKKVKKCSLKNKKHQIKWRQTDLEPLGKKKTTRSRTTQLPKMNDGTANYLTSKKNLTDLVHAYLVRIMRRGDQSSRRVLGNENWRETGFNLIGYSDLFSQIPWNWNSDTTQLSPIFSQKRL